MRIGTTISPPSTNEKRAGLTLRADRSPSKNAYCAGGLSLPFFAFLAFFSALSFFI
jgi:hypothetical protein